MITAHTDTMIAVELLKDSVTTTLITIGIDLCLPRPARGAALLPGALRQRTHTLILGYETHSLLLIQRGATYTGMTEDEELIELIITAEADRLIPRSRDIRLLSGLQDKPPKPLIPLKGPLCPLEEAQDHDPTAGLQAPTLSAAPAAQAATGSYCFCKWSVTLTNVCPRWRRLPCVYCVSIFSSFATL